MPRRESSKFLARENVVALGQRIAGITGALDQVIELGRVMGIESVSHRPSISLANPHGGRTIVRWHSLTSRSPWIILKDNDNEHSLPRMGKTEKVVQFENEKPIRTDYRTIVMPVSSENTLRKIQAHPHPHRSGDVSPDASVIDIPSIQDFWLPSSYLNPLNIFHAIQRERMLSQFESVVPVAEHVADQLVVDSHNADLNLLVARAWTHSAIR